MKSSARMMLGFCGAVVIGLALFTRPIPADEADSSESDRAGSRVEESAADEKADGREQVRRDLRQPVAFEFDCEPLRDVLNFLTTITGIHFFVDENIFEQYGKTEDCYGDSVDRKTIFVTVSVTELPLEPALAGMLRQHGLGFSIEDGYVYIFSPGEPQAGVSQSPDGMTQADSEESVCEGEPETEAGSTDGEWPDIRVKSVFDPTNRGIYIAILEVSNRRIFVKEGARIGAGLVVLKIDGTTDCVTVCLRDSEEEREYCR